MFANLLAVLASVEGIALGLLWWYHGRKTRTLSDRVAAAEAAVDSLRSVNTELRESLQRVVDQTAARNEREAHDDARIAEAARMDPGRAADLLRSLYPGGSGSPSATSGLPTAGVPRLP